MRPATGLIPRRPPRQTPGKKPRRTIVFRLDGKVALVTGAGSVGPGWGNGKATAVLLARAGAQVFGIDITESAAAETRDLITAEGGTAIAHRCDMLVAE